VENRERHPSRGEFISKNGLWGNYGTMAKTVNELCFQFQGKGGGGGARDSGLGKRRRPETFPTRHRGRSGGKGAVYCWAVDEERRYGKYIIQN